MNAFGYVKFESLYTQEQIDALKKETEQLVEKTYTKEELEKHSVYPSDTTDSRVSNAVMVSEGESTFPKVEHREFAQISSFLTDHNELLSELTETKVSGASRCMLNYQNYFEGSKPVGEHFDGEFLKTARNVDGIEFKLLEGIIPRYVSLIILANGNDGKGVELLDKDNHHLYQPKLSPGDVVIFDNIKLRHRVPTLEKPRTSIGLRNFDHMPLHFADSENEQLNGNYFKLSEGYFSKDVDCFSRLTEFMEKEWPLLKAEYGSYF